MRTAIICAGPSALHTWGLQDHPHHWYDTVIAINAAAACAWVGAYDYWFAGDQKTVLTVEPFTWPDLAVVTMAENLERPQLAGRHLIQWQTITRNYPKQHGPPNWSDQTAMWFAADQLMAKVIDVYGADFRGTVDCAGRDFEKHRSPEKWAERLARFDALADHLATKGVAVERIQP